MLPMAKTQSHTRGSWGVKWGIMVWVDHFVMDFDRSLGTCHFWEPTWSGNGSIHFFFLTVQYNYIDNCVLNAQTPETLRPPILCAVIRNVSALHAGITPIFCVRKLDITFKCLDYRERMSRPRTTKWRKSGVGNLSSTPTSWQSIQIWESACWQIFCNNRFWSFVKYFGHCRALARYSPTYPKFDSRNTRVKPHKLGFSQHIRCESAWALVWATLKRPNVMK